MPEISEKNSCMHEDQVVMIRKRQFILWTKISIKGMEMLLINTGVRIKTPSCYEDNYTIKMVYENVREKA